MLEIILVKLIAIPTLIATIAVMILLENQIENLPIPQVIRYTPVKYLEKELVVNRAVKRLVKRVILDLTRSTMPNGEMFQTFRIPILLQVEATLITC